MAARAAAPAHLSSADYENTAFEDDLTSNSDNDDGTVPKTSGEQARQDREVLDEEEEREKLLTGQVSRQEESSFFHRLGQSGRRKRAKHSTRSSKYRDGTGKVMYEMEEGGPGSATPVSSSSEEDQEKVEILQARPRKRESCCAKVCRYAFINVLIAALFIAISFGAYKATTDDSSHKSKVSYRTNGTHEFAPTTVLVSLDGFRADFLQRGLTPTLNGFIREGVSPVYMLPSFPSVTFPNHYTLVTGLYPESHGIVGNTFWDPTLKQEFYYTHEDAQQPHWWNGEPLWVTAEHRGVRTAIHMWPGSEAHIGSIEPSFVDKYNGSEVLARKVDRILEFLDKPGPNLDNLTVVVDDQRPQLIAAYVPNVDSDGHKFGPNSTEIRTTIQEVDTMLHSLLQGLHERNLTDIINVVVVSDHGMATTSAHRLIQYEELVDSSLIEHIDGWPHYGLRPKDTAITDILYDHLMELAAEREGFDVFTRENMPERYHFSNNERIAPVWIVPHTGWAIVTRDEFNVSEGRSNGEVYHPRGLHGYDHEDPLMRAIFVARGPSFPHQPGSRVDVFQNTEVYNILCDSLGLEPKPNNGTLRLPLRPIGLHSQDPFAGESPVHDPPIRNSSVQISPTSMPTPLSGPTSNTTHPTIDEDRHTDLTASWLDWFHDRVDDVKTWISIKLPGKNDTSNG